MNFKRNLLNIVGISNKQINVNSLDLFHNVPFVCKYNHVEPNSYNQRTLTPNCCFSHVIGMPMKGNQLMPMFYWQKTYLFDSFEEYKYNWVKKATGIGASEFALRYIIWKCLVNDDWSNGIVCIVTGQNIDLAKRLIARAYELVHDFIPEAKISDYKLIINNVEITAFPGGNMDAMRSLINVRLILLEEADFFSIGEQQEARKISERYIAKSPGLSILMISTPNAPGGLYETIELENPSIYNKIFLPYTIGLGSIFSKEEILGTTEDNQL